VVEQSKSCACITLFRLILHTCICSGLGRSKSDTYAASTLPRSQHSTFKLQQQESSIPRTALLSIDTPSTPISPHERHPHTPSPDITSPAHLLQPCSSTSSKSLSSSSTASPFSPKNDSSLGVRPTQSTNPLPSPYSLITPHSRLVCPPTPSR